MNVEMTLCKPCAMGMVASGKMVKHVAGCSKKITCANCGRRRYGVSYEMIEKQMEGDRG